MKKYTLLLCFIAVTHFVSAQDPVSWNYSVKKLSDKIFEIHLTATLQSGWHTYSQSTPSDGPLPTSISFAKNPLIIMNGHVKEEGKLQQKYEAVFGINVKYFSNKIDFVQQVTLKANAKTTVSGIIEYMVCTDERCLPPVKLPFKVVIP
ncbi:MAG: hypothetical protein JWO92_1160 [Chitinophagaceae bacterium]|nr:hypothetical protein [Chitinophagaceae bacterium]